MHADDDAHGREADRPTEIPSPGWKDVGARVLAESKADDVPLLAAGVAFYALLAAVPALVAVVSVYGMVADPANISSQVERALGSAPPEARTLATKQLHSIITASGGAKGVGLVVGIALALWSASSGMRHLIGAVNLAYDEEDSRGFVKLRATALALTLGAVAFTAVVAGAAAAIPAVGGPAGIAIGVVEALVLFVAFIVGLAVIYRYGPDRDAPQWRWVSWGSAFAAVTWVVASVLFSIYVSGFSSYNKTYGSLGGVIVVLLWLLISAAAVILGAEVNAELERQTTRDSTAGPARPMGDRGAYAADTVGSERPTG